MLPSRDDHSNVLWWSDDELALLAGTSAHGEARLIAEADAVCGELLADALATDVEAHGEDAVIAAVRAALVTVLSRSYSGRSGRILVPS